MSTNEVFSSKEKLQKGRDNGRRKLVDIWKFWIFLLFSETGWTGQVLVVKSKMHNEILKISWKNISEELQNGDDKSQKLSKIKIYHFENDQKYFFY